MKMKLQWLLAFDCSVNWHLSFELYELVEVDRARLRCDFPFGQFVTCIGRAICE